MMLKPRTLALSLMFMTPAALFAQAATPLSLESAVASALERNFDVRIQKITTSGTAEDIAIADADFTPEFGLTASHSVNQQAAASSTLDGTTAVGPRSESDDTRLSVTQKIVSGATITASGSLDRAETNSSYSTLNPAYDSDVSISIRQPLLNGFGTTVNRASRQNARLGYERSQFDLTSTVLDVVRDVEAAYFNLGYAREQQIVREFSLEVARKLLEENKARRETGVSTDLDVLQAEVGVANANRSLLLAKQTVKDREDELLRLIGSTDFEQSPGAIALPEAPKDLQLDYTHSYSLALANQPDYASTRLAIEQRRIAANTTKNGRLPTLDLGAAVGYNSTARTSGDALNEVWSGDGYSWQVDLSLTVPWGMKAERARYRQALSNLRSTETQLHQIEQNLTTQVRSAIRAVYTNQESVSITRLAVELSQKQFDLEKARYDSGLSTFRRVQEAQEDLDTAHIDALDALVQLHIALADLSRVEATSLSRYHITLEN